MRVGREAAATLSTYIIARYNRLMGDIVSADPIFRDLVLFYFIFQL